MDFVVLGIGLIFLICVIVGIYKGAIKIAVSLVTTLLTLVIVFFATPFVADLIESKTPVDSMIKDQVMKTMASVASEQLAGAQEDGIDAEDVRKALEAAGVSEEKLQEYGISIDDIVNGEISSEQLAEYGISKNVLAGLGTEGSTGIEEALENADIPKDLQIKAIEMAELPEVFKSLLSDNNNDVIYEKLGVKTFAEYVGEFLSKLIIHIVAFLCTFLLVTIVLRAIIFALDIVSELPVLGFFNRLAGGVVGAAGGLIIIWLFFVVITLLYVTAFGREIYQVIQENAILNMLYENNPLMKLATNFM
ncbi:MAG: CvpA family protein [Lachnospiraceae bacterium]|mgnify:FL=1|nr:CvpA family protein [Lachnospiraceae bacterium]